MASDGLAGKTMALYMSAARGLHDEMEAQGVIDWNIFRHPMVRLPRGARRAVNPPRAFAEWMAHRILESCQVDRPVDYALASVLLNTGMRPAEILNLTFSDVRQSVEGCLVALRIRHSKTHVHRLQPLADWAAEALLTYYELMGGDAERRDRALFPISMTTMHSWWKRRLDIAGLPKADYSLRSCRKTVVSELLRRGESLRNTALVTGHSNPSMLRVYDDERLEISDNPAMRLDYKGKRYADVHESSGASNVGRAGDAARDENRGAGIPHRGARRS